MTDAEPAVTAAPRARTYERASIGYTLDGPEVRAGRRADRPAVAQREGVAGCPGGFPGEDGGCMTDAERKESCRIS